MTIARIIRNRGVVVVGTGPTWAQQQTDKTWTTPFTNTLSDLEPSPLPTNNGGGQQEIIVAYSGGCVNQSRKSLNVNGGGHNNSAENSIYEGIVDAEAPAWTRPFGPTPNGSVLNADTYADGNPSSVHSRNNILSIGDYFYLVGQAGFWAEGNTGGKLWKYSYTGDTYSQPATFSGLGMVISDALNGEAVYNSVSSRIWLVNQNGEICTYNPANDATALLTANQVSGLTYEFRVEFVPEANAMVLYRPASNTLLVFDCASPGSGWQVATVGSAPITFTNCPGMVWHPATGAMILWGQSTNRDRLYKMIPPDTTPTSAAGLIGTWTWATVNAAGGTETPDAPLPGGTGEGSTRGRFNIVKNLANGQDFLVLVNSVTSPVYCYKIPLAGLS